MAKYKRDDGYPTGAQCGQDASTWVMIIGIPMCFLFPPLGIFMVIVGLFNRQVTAPIFDEREHNMSKNVKGKGVTLETTGELAETTGVGCLGVLVSFILGMAGLLFFL